VAGISCATARRLVFFFDEGGRVGVRACVGVVLGISDRARLASRWRVVGGGGCCGGVRKRLDGPCALRSPETHVVPSWELRTCRSRSDEVTVNPESGITTNHQPPLARARFFRTSRSKNTNTLRYSLGRSIIKVSIVISIDDSPSPSVS
jgi:hypothetical protein